MTATRTPAPARIEAREKVTGTAKYAYEYERDDVAYAWIVPATVARGRVRAIGPAPDVLAVLSHENAPRLKEVDDHELAVLQSPEVSYRGQIVACVVAESLEAARQAAKRSGGARRRRLRRRARTGGGVIS